ncbi:MAG: hypothetical protein U0414_08980 [Polyangiaceae bacterium]
MSSNVSPDQTTQLSPAAKKVPIIVVPGTMGTRLAEPSSGELVWNPTGGGRFGDASGPWAGDPARLTKIQAALEPDTKNWPDGYADADRAAGITNFSHLVPDYYDDLCFALREDLGNRLKPLGVEPCVYVCGYDWRVGNDLSAVRLQAVVQSARQACGGERAILVAHGQGGLVARYFCRALGGEAWVRAMFLIGSPLLGAPITYARLKRGIIAADDGVQLWFVRQYMGLNDTESKDLLRSFPGFYQLLPTKLLTSQSLAADGAEPRLWLAFDTSQSGYPASRDPGNDSEEPVPLTDCTTDFPQIYKDVYVGFGEQTTGRSDHAGYVDDAQVFDQRVLVGSKVYVHPVTYSIACADVDTPVQVDLPKYGEVTAQGNDYVYTPEKSFWGNPKEPELDLATGPGDGSMPMVSTTPDPSLLSTPFTPFGASYPEVSGVEHADLPNDPGVIQRIVEELERIVPVDASDETGDAADDAPVRLEFKSRYTSQDKPADRDCYTTTEWVAHDQLPFLVGQGRSISVRVAAPVGASATWKVTPIGTHSGTIKTSTGSGSEFEFTPEVTNTQRPTSASRSPNPPVEYDIEATVVVAGTTYTKKERITQDERDIIRQEFLDQRMWRSGFELHIPYRNRLVETTIPELRGNYTLILDSAVSHLLEATTAELASTSADLGVELSGITVSSGWRNPRRNLAAGSKIVNSNHQHGGAVDMQPNPWGSGATHRKAMLALYNAALAVADARMVLIEHGWCGLMLKGKTPVPAAEAGDEDGLPEQTLTFYKIGDDGKKFSTTGTYADMFDYATHVHIDKDPVDGGSDD